MGRSVPAAVFATLLFLGGCSEGGGTASPVDVDRSAAVATRGDGWASIATFTEGDGADQVTLRHRAEEVAPGGPTALAIGPDGVIAVADMLAGRIVRVHPERGALAPIAMYGVEDVGFDSEGRLHAFSRASSRVAVFDDAGQEIDLIEIPRTMRWVTGLCPMPDGGLGLHTAYQESVALDAQHLHTGLAEGVPGRGGLRYRTLRRNGEATIEVRDETSTIQRLPVDVETQVGSLELVGTAEDGDIIVDVQDVVDSRPIAVDRWLRRYGPAGDLHGQIAVPRGSYVPAHPLELAADGTVYLLLPSDDGVEVRAWSVREGGVR